MASLLTLILSFITITFTVIAAIKIMFKRKVKDLSLRLECFPSFWRFQKCREETPHQGNIQFYLTLEEDLENSFKNQFISSKDEGPFTDYYQELFNEIKRLQKWINLYHIKASDIILQFLYDFENIPILVKRHNEEYIKSELDTHKNFFNHCLKYPLDEQQRRSIVSEEDNCLVVSSAGSGKTSSIVGKVKYLINIRKVDPQNILLISYTNKAASELTERMGIEGMRGFTFHKLAIDIIGKTTGQKPSICNDTDALFLKIYQDLLSNKKFKKSVIGYILDYKANESEQERKENERREQLIESKATRFKAQFPDMDGKIIYVRSEQEQKICLALSLLGVKFRYEEPYEHPLADAMHSQYRPDFSIYFEKNGKTQRIYLEHFGVDEHSLVPLWFAQERNISYEEANQLYNDGITWKRAAHEKFGTKLLTTSSADFRYYDIQEKLKKELEENEVPIQEKNENELYELVLPRNSKQEKSFIRLIVTFVTLMKSSCKSFGDVLQMAKNSGDERNEFIIKNICQPIYKRYQNELNNLNQIDFTDAILQATEICRSSNVVNYSYIIVDEFQDISIDRYHFLKVLRAGNPPAKLYCVGDDWQSIYRFSGSDMALFNQFSDYFGKTDINKIETTYRFGEPLVSLSSQFIQKNKIQIRKDIQSSNPKSRTELQFFEYDRTNYCNVIEKIIASIPADKSIFLLGRYSFDDYYLSYKYKSAKNGQRFFYFIENREIEFLTVHKSKGLEADYVIILQCNKDTYGFPSLVNDDSVLNYVLTKSDQYPYGEERRLFYVAMTRAKIKTYIMYDRRNPSVFVDEFLHPEKISEESYAKYPNANKKWTRNEEKYLLYLHCQGESIKSIANKLGRSQTSIVMRIAKLEEER